MRRIVLAAAAALALPLLVAQPVVAGTTASTSVSAHIGYFGTTTTTAIDNGDVVTIAGVVKADGATAPGLSVELWAKAWGGDWAHVASQTSDGTGRLFLDRRPSKQTFFQWRFPGDAEHAASTSNTLTVKVRTRVGFRVADSSLSSGQRLVATGGTRPAKPGETAILWRASPLGRTKLGSATVRSDGTYRITKVLTKRRSSTHYVTVSAGSGNLLGISGYRTVTVR